MIHDWKHMTQFRTVLRNVGAVVMVVMLASACAVSAQEADIGLSLPPKGMDPAPEREALETTRRDVQSEADKRYQQARLLFKLKRWQDCIDACDHALAVDSTHGPARNLKNQATRRKNEQARDNLTEERRTRDQEALRMVTEEGLIPHRRADVPRPEVKESDVPFAAVDQINDESRQVLGSRLPEVNLIDADLNYVLQLLFKTTGVNIIYNPEDIENKTVTIHARNLRLKDILDYLSRSYDVGYTVNDGTVWVYAADKAEAEKALLRPAIFPLKYGLTGIPVNHQMKDEQEGGQAGQARRIAQQAGLGGGSDQNQTGSDIESMLTWMESNWPGWPEETRWWLDRKLNRLVVISTPYIIEEVGKMVKMLDVPPIQVLVMTRFIDVRENDIDQLGFNWRLRPHPRGMPADVPADGTWPRGSWQDDKVRLQTTASNLGVGADALTAGTVAILNEHELTFALQALEQMTNNKLVTAPRIIAYNNHTRNIDLTDSLPYQSDVRTETVTTSTDTNTTSSTTLIPEFETEELGFRLTVTPSVGSDMKTISLVVTPEITDQTGTVTKSIIVANPDATGDKAQRFDLERPIINTQKLTVEATVEDNETLVVGGLSRDNLTETTKAVPVLSKVPVLGRLFQSKDNQRSRSCLLIFVTAKIITSQNRLYTDRVKKARRELAEEAVANGADIPVDELNRLLGDPDPSTAR